MQNKRICHIPRAGFRIVNHAVANQMLDKSETFFLTPHSVRRMPMSSLVTTFLESLDYMHLAEIEQDASCKLCRRPFDLHGPLHFETKLVQLSLAVE